MKSEKVQAIRVQISDSERRQITEGIWDGLGAELIGRMGGDSEKAKWMLQTVVIHVCCAIERLVVEVNKP